MTKKRKKPSKRPKIEPVEPELLVESANGTSQEQRMKRSEENMQRARRHAMTKEGFNREEWRERAKECVKKTTGFDAYNHQLNTGEALALRMDALVLVGTGGGKTIPFAFPTLMSAEGHRMVWIFVPLKELQTDLAVRLTSMGLNPAVVNGETYTDRLYEEILRLDYNVILSGPEMALHHPQFSRVTRNSDFMSHFDACIFDEVHCIPQWGRDFREVYSEVGRLRSFFPESCPVLLHRANESPRARVFAALIQRLPAKWAVAISRVVHWLKHVILAAVWIF